jgi:transcriptional regulator of acetoin/glycerol metabolism
VDATVTQHAANVLKFVRDSSSLAERRAGVTNAAIAESWRRCVLDYSLDPGRHYDPSILDAHILRERQTEHEDLLRIASAEIDWLYEYIAESGCALILTDASGLVLYAQMDPTLQATFHAAGLRVGADWSERREGTNGIGTCIAADLPVIVHRDEHFRACHIRLSCAGSPIRDPAGSLIAVLDASTLNARGGRTTCAHTLALMNLSARLIEKALFLRRFEDGPIFRFHARPEFVNLQHDGALALAGDTTVLAIDEIAARLLGVANRNELIGRRIDEIFDVRADELIDPVRGSRPLLWPVRDVRLGRKFFASVVLGTARAQHPVVRTGAADDSRQVMQFGPSTAHKSPLALEELAGNDPQMLRNVRSAIRVATSRVPVLIQGPTGAGKEIFARALHLASGRAAHRFVALNCAAIPESLIESELFGYAAGAFTGARKEGMKGKILQSSGGTLFLDEIGDMPLSLQTRLLRVLEEQEVVPLGAESLVKVDLRVVCASHQNLREMLARGEFREDLYYRLNGITLNLPSLAQRTDKERLIREFLGSETDDGRPAAIEMDAFRCLLAYGWPGNIRELRNVIRMALAISDGGVIRLRDLPAEVREGAACVPGAGSTVTAKSYDGSIRADVERAIRDSGGNMTHAAELLGTSRNTLYRRCRSLGIPLRQH